MVIRGRDFNNREITLINELISNNPSFSRQQLSTLICQSLDWRQPNGRLKDRACRDVLYRLEAKQLIRLPPPRHRRQSRPHLIRPPQFIEPSHILTGKITDFRSIHFQLAATSKDRRLWNYLTHQYHYIGLTTQVGRHLKFFIYLDHYMAGCIAFADAVFHHDIRDQWIGWTRQQRRHNLHRVINNVRFLILPWIKIANLASKILSQAVKMIPSCWQDYYGYTPLLAETFIEKNRFAASCYRAANWIYLGDTIGKARSGMNYFYHGIPKMIYVFPLQPNRSVQQRLCQASS